MNDIDTETNNYWTKKYGDKGIKCYRECGFYITNRLIPEPYEHKLYFVCMEQCIKKLNKTTDNLKNSLNN
jgi:hypothetical protein